MLELSSLWVPHFSFYLEKRKKCMFYLLTTSIAKASTDAVLNKGFHCSYIKVQPHKISGKVPSPKREVALKAVGESCVISHKTMIGSKPKHNCRLFIAEQQQVASSFEVLYSPTRQKQSKTEEVCSFMLDILICPPNQSRTKWFVSST